MIVLAVLLAVGLAVVVGVGRGRVAKRGASSAPSPGVLGRERRCGPGRLPGSRGGM